MAVEMTTKCADWINVKEYVDLEHYLIYLKEAGYLRYDGIYCVNKKTGEREVLLDVSGGIIPSLTVCRK